MRRSWEPGRSFVQPAGTAPSRAQFGDRGKQLRKVLRVHMLQTIEVLPHSPARQGMHHRSGDRAAGSRTNRRWVEAGCGSTSDGVCRTSRWLSKEVQVDRSRSPPLRPPPAQRSLDSRQERQHFLRLKRSLYEDLRRRGKLPGRAARPPPRSRSKGSRPAVAIADAGLAARRPRLECVGDRRGSIEPR